MIQYPVARAPDGSAVHIDGWERGQRVTCFGCDEELVGRLPHDGIKPTAHFAHKADSSCAGETALHRATKAAIMRAHVTGGLDALSWACPRCLRWKHETDLRALTLRQEARPCEGVVSDVLGENAAGEPCVAIEVVVTHDVELQTLERYRMQGIYVLSLRASWGILRDLLCENMLPLVELRVGYVDAKTCPGCQQVQREKEEWNRRVIAQAVAAWWSAWTSVWLDVGKEMMARQNAEWRATWTRNVHVQAWWTAWGRMWPRIAETIVSTWWATWHQAWREIGATHARPHIWQRQWRTAWEMIGKQVALDAADRERRRDEEERRWQARAVEWWNIWVRIWPDIAQRESGVMAAWKPICGTCRADLTPGHRCP